MDVVCGQTGIQVLTFDNEMEGKQYAGGAEFLESDNDADPGFRKDVFDKIKALYELMSVQFSPTPFDKFNSYVAPWS